MARSTAAAVQVLGLALAGVALVGCKSEGDPKAAEPGTDEAVGRSDAEQRETRDGGAALATKDVKAPDAGAALEPLEIPLAARCESPCLFLAEHRFASMSGGAYCELCKEVKAKACELEWPPIADEPTCDDWDRWRRCLLAAHGYRFRSARARAEFRRKRWYDSRRGVKPSRLGPVARANHKYLKERATACRETLAARKGRVIARLRGDLDGDKRPERAVVTDTEVRVGRERLEHGLRPDDPMAAIEATLIDIDVSDRALEILVALHGGDEAASRYAVVYVSGEPKRRGRRRPGPLSVAPVIETFGTVEPTGDGALEVREEQCGRSREASYRYEGGVIKKAAERSDGRYERSRCE